MPVADGLGGYGWAAQFMVGKEAPQLLELALRP